MSQSSHSGHSGAGAIIAALGANIGIAILKFLAFALTRSSSMLAEGIHSLADSGNQLLLLVGGRASRKQADEEHPFGYGRNRYIYAFIVSIIIFSLGGLFALYEGFEKLHNPHGITEWQWVPVAVLVGSILLEGNSFRVAVKESSGLKGQQSWLRFLRTSKNPELPVLLLEDAGALVGLLLALVGVGMTLLTGNGLWDAFGTLAIGILLVFIAVFLAVEMKSLILGEAASLRLCTWVLRRFWWRQKFAFMMLTPVVRWLMRLTRLRFVFARLFLRHASFIWSRIFSVPTPRYWFLGAHLCWRLLRAYHTAQTQQVRAYPLKHTNV